MAALDRFANQALNITWSLAIEEQFYLLLPLMIRWIPLRRLPWVLLALIVAGAGLRVLLYTIWPSRAGLWCYVLLPCRWDPLFLGVLGAWALRQPAWGSRLANAGRLLWASTLFLGLLMLAAAITAKGVIMAPAMSLGGYFVLGLFYFSGVMLVLTGHAPRIAAWLRHPWLVHIGIISYGIYLLHESMDGLVHAVLLNAKPRFQTPIEMVVSGLALAITIAVASLSWRWFERPFVEWSHRQFRYQNR
jgi:peptidoglycan/LPS O-acetylase OafA/YrhL